MKQTHDIGWAVTAMLRGNRVCRSGWSGKNMWIAINNPSEDQPTTRQRMTRPYVYMKTAQGDYIPWLCSQADLLAGDWEEAC